jgi:hypothetical protein
VARARKKAGPTAVVHLPDVGYSLAPAGTPRISAKVAEAIAAWIKKV